MTGNCNLIGKSLRWVGALHAAPSMNCIMWGLVHSGPRASIYIRRGAYEEDNKPLRVHYRGLRIMEFLNAYLLSPGSIIVALSTVIFLVHQSWPHLSRPKKGFQVSNEASGVDSASSLAVSKEPEVPEGWWSGREVFELERRAIFSKV